MFKKSKSSKKTIRGREDAAADEMYFSCSESFDDAGEEAKGINRRFSFGNNKKKVIKDEEISVFEGVVAPWSGIKLSKWKDRFIIRSAKFEFPIHRPYNELTNEEKKIVIKQSLPFSDIL